MKIINLFITVVLGFALLGSCKNISQQETQKRTKSEVVSIKAKEITSTEKPVINEPKGIPQYVVKTLQYIDTYQKAPDQYVGGRTFMNFEKRLPIETASGKKIRYKEWDVFPKIKGRNRGPERLVTGSDKSAYYTKNHYQTFIKIR